MSPTAKKRLSVIQLSRWLISAMALITACALIFFSWQTYNRVENSKDVLIQARVKALQMALTWQIAEPRAVTTEQLHQVVQNVAPDELTYLAIVDRQGIIAATGHPTKPFADHSFPAPPFSIRVREGLVQAAAPFHRRPPLLPPPEPTPSGRPMLNDGHEVWLLFEFTPVEALELFRGAAQSLYMCIFTSLLLLLATLLFWRFSLKAEKQEIEEAHSKRLAALGEMTAVLGHEIRNPLTSLKGHAQLLQEGLPACHPGHESLEMIIKESKRLEYLTNHILGFARPTSSQPTEFFLLQVVKEAIQSLPPECQVELTAPEQLPPLYGDPFKLRQALINLFLNGHEAAPEKPLQCQLDLKKNQLAITIRDFGPGLPTDNPQKIFEPYFTTKIKGTGLGLAIVKSTIDEFAGTISASNAPEGGAVFNIYLPIK